MKNQRRLWLSYRRPRGKAGREGEVNNVGINKYSGGDRVSERGIKIKSVKEREKERGW